MGQLTSGDVAEAEAALRLNYNTTGVTVMQAMYSSEYLSIGGPASTDALAAAGAVVPTDRVLDIGCGVGGPALRLAEAIGCRVTGVDLVETSIDMARASAERRGLADLVDFAPADATRLPCVDNSFDVVWGQDAWCHVPDKAALVAECARVLVTGGRVVFTDWLAGEHAAGTVGEQALDAALSRYACTVEEYRQLLGDAGFIDLAVNDISQDFTGRYVEICDGLNSRRDELVEQFGQRVFDIVAGTNGTILEGFQTGAIAGGRFVGRLRS